MTLWHRHCEEASGDEAISARSRANVMTKDQIKAVLERVPTWPANRQLELAEIALEIEAEFTGAEHEATPEELATIAEGLDGEAASGEEVREAFTVSRKV